jgi:molybdate transport system permease protein
MAWDALLLSIETAILATAIAAIIGGGLGKLLATRSFFGRDLVDALVMSPMVMPPTVLGYYALVILGVNSPIGRGFEAIFGSPIVFTRTGVLVAAVIGAVPLVAKGARTAFEGVDRGLISAARTLGATPWRAFYSVELALALPGIASGLMLGFARSLGDFGLTLMIAGDIPGVTQTAPLAIYDAVQGNRDADALAMVAVLTAIALVCLFVANKLLGLRRD